MQQDRVPVMFDSLIVLIQKEKQIMNNLLENTEATYANINLSIEGSELETLLKTTEIDADGGYRLGFGVWENKSWETARIHGEDMEKIHLAAFEFLNKNFDLSEEQWFQDIREEDGSRISLEEVIARLK